MKVNNVINSLLFSLNFVAFFLGGLSFLVGFFLYVVTKEHKPGAIKKLFQPLFLVACIGMATLLILSLEKI